MTNRRRPLRQELCEVGKRKRTSHTAIPASIARTRLGALLTELHADKRRFLITRGGKPAAVLLDPEAYEDMLDELDPAFRKKLAASERDRVEGRTLSLSQLISRHVVGHRGSVYR